MNTVVNICGELHFATHGTNGHVDIQTKIHFELMYKSRGFVEVVMITRCFR